MKALILLLLSLLIWATPQKSLAQSNDYYEQNLKKINIQRILRFKRPLKLKEDKTISVYAESLHTQYKHSNTSKGEVICPTTADYYGTEWKTFMMSKHHRKVLMSRGIKYIAISISQGNTSYCAMRVW